MNFSEITDDLFIGTTPKTEDYDTLRNLGISLVINMRAWPKPKTDDHETPMRTLWLRTFDSPFLPIPIDTLKRGVAAAVEEMENGGKVYAHCQFGRHRGAAMAAAILIAQGHGADEAMTLIKEMRPNADPYIWYIKSRIRKFEAAWQTAESENSSGE